TNGSPGKMTFTTASGDCRLRPAGAERSSFGNTIFGWAVGFTSQCERRGSIHYCQLGKLAFGKRTDPRVTLGNKKRFRRYPSYVACPLGASRHDSIFNVGANMHESIDLYI